MAEEMPIPVRNRVASSIGSPVAKPFARENREKMAVNSIIARTRPIRSASTPPIVPPIAMPRKPAAVIVAMSSRERRQLSLRMGAA